MPVLPSSYQRAPWYQFNGHLQTILPAMLRRVELSYQRERLELADGDFLDLDWLRGGHRRLAILGHGLEGNAQRVYVRGMAEYLHAQGWDVLAWNCRSCSGEMNRTARLYYHGEIEDLGVVVAHALGDHAYDVATLIGFSMGGSMLLKYMGVHGDELHSAIIGGIAFSAPCDLAASVEALEYRGNGIYKKRFLKRLSQKMQAKEQQFPGLLPVDRLPDIRHWEEFDTLFSAPVSGFDSPTAFYHSASAKNFMEGLRRPALLVNAVNDPILPEACTPVAMARRMPDFFVEQPQQGGHVGFALRGGRYWMEQRVTAFLAELGQQGQLSVD